MADDIGGFGEDPRDVARRRLNVGRRAREAEAARRAGQPSGPSMTPSRQSMTPYREGQMTVRPPEGSAEMLRRGAGMPSGGGAAGRGMSMRGPGIAGAGLAGMALIPPLLERYRNREQSPEDQDIAEAYRTNRDVRDIRREREEVMRPGRSANVGEGGTLQSRETMRPQPEPEQEPERPVVSPASRARPPASRPAARGGSTTDDLNAIVLKLQRGEAPTTETERRLADRMGIAYRKGGLVKPKGHGAKEEAMEMKGGRYRGGAKEERAEMKAKGGIIKSKAKSPAKLKGKTLMKKGGMAKGGEAGLASTLRGGVVKKPGTDSFNFQAKKMATGGVVQKGGSKYGFTTAKTKMLRRGGMAKGCK